MITAIFAAIVAFLFLLGAYTAFRPDVIKATKEEYTRKKETKRVLNLEEIEEVKTYAEVFGLDNHHSVSTLELLEMGRKAQQYLGSERMKEIAEQARTCSNVFYIPATSVYSITISHLVRGLLKVADLIAIQNIAVFMTVLMGGDRNGEEESII